MEKYLVASSGDNLDSKISGRFGHANYFLVVNPVLMDFEVFPGVSKKEKAPDVSRFADMGINKVLSGNIGPGSFEEIVSEGMEVYLCRNMTVREAVQKVSEGEIQPIREPTLKEGIHSARKSSGSGRGQGKGLGKGIGSRGKGYGRGKGRGRNR